MAMNLQQLQDQITKNREEMGKRIAPAARLANENNIRAMMFGNDEQLNSLRNNEAAKVRELYEYDKGLASAQQGPPGFIDDPISASRYKAEQTQARAGELADIQKGVANRRDVLGDALEKALKMLNYGLEASQLEYSGLKDERDFAYKVQQDKETKADKKGTPDKRIQEATDKAVEALLKTLEKAGEGEDKKNIIWQWINKFEPGFKAKGIDAAVLWDIYDKTPDNKMVSVSSSNSNPLQNMFPYLEHRGIAPDPYKLEIPEMPSQQKFVPPKFLLGDPTKSASASRVLKK